MTRTDGSKLTLPLRSARDQEIDKAQQERMVIDTKILQKVNKVHRDAFKEKFPGQIEHCMRLTAERLQAVLTNKPHDMTDPTTWSASAQDILSLSHGLYYLSIINQHYPVEED